MTPYTPAAQPPMAAARLPALVILLLCLAVGSREAEASPESPKAVAATLKRDSQRCRASANLDACYDAIRRNPSDPGLLVALGDALARAKRPADANRAYRRAQALAPDTRGLAAKISATETKLSPKHGAKRPPTHAAAGQDTAPAKRYSNAEQDTQSH